MKKETEEQRVEVVGDSLWRVFDERRRELERSKEVWRNWFLVNILLLLGLALFVFFELAAGFAARSWLEFSVVLPLVYSAIFFHAQHSKAREYLEEYSFKSVIARSLGAYRSFLREDVNRDHPEEQKKFLDFMISATQDLFVPPRKIISKNPVKEEDVKVGVVEKLGDVFKKFIPKGL
jgi:hypothetical protein